MPAPNPATKAAYEAELAALRAKIIAGEQADTAGLNPHFFLAAVVISIVLGFVVGLALRLAFAA